MHEEYSASTMDCKQTASVLELTNRRLFEPQKLQKRVSFKDDAWVIHIPAREENDIDLRESVVLRNAVAGRPGLTNRTVTPNRRTSSETLSRTSLYANRDQRTPQTQSYMTGSGHSVTTRGPFKSILKTPTPIRKKEDHLHRSQQDTARCFREVSVKNSVDSCFKQDLSHLLPSKDSVHRLEKPVLTRNLPTRRSLTISRALSSDDDLGYNKTGRFVGKEFTGPSRTPFQHNFNNNERTKTFNIATQPERDINIVGVTYRSVNEMPYFYDIKGLTNRMNEYPSDAKSPLNDRARLEHSSVSTSLNQSGSRRKERYLSAIPAIEAFNRRNRGTRRYSSSGWTHEQVTSPKRQLPIAWQPAKQYNFSTK